MEGKSSFSGFLVLDSHNYSDRKIKMENLLIVTDLYEPIDRKEIAMEELGFEWKIL